jgi:methylmalonyl-CoA mutase
VAAQAAIDAQAPAVLICAPDDRYPEIVPLLIGKIRAERPDTIILLAGYPKEQIEAHKAAGIDGFIYLGANCYEINLELQEMINLTG